MPKIIVLVGPPGSGKSTLSKKLENPNAPGEHGNRVFNRVSQDDQGKDHLKFFQVLISLGADIVLDRMNFNKQQRERYLKPAKDAGYESEIIVLHENKETCMDRMLKRKGHPTVVTEKDASSALHTFFKLYERPTQDEANVITNLGWDGIKEPALCVDIDGTLANILHRQHYVSGKSDSKENQKKNWSKFFSEISNDKVNKWCSEIMEKFSNDHKIILCSGRPDSHKKQTLDWLNDNDIIYDKIFMRLRDDYRADTIIKQNILDFELKTKYNIKFCVDDRKCVTKMWRDNGLTCLQCAPGEF